jgi:hypothetical protein
VKVASERRQLRIQTGGLVMGSYRLSSHKSGLKLVVETEKATYIGKDGPRGLKRGRHASGSRESMACRWSEGDGVRLL